jgi:tetratricopeptide (TPR) repeat protein
MRRITLILGLLAAACPQLYAQCPSTAQLASAEGDLLQGKPDAPAQMLAPLQESFPACHEIVLLLGRVRAAQGRPELARDLLTRYTQLEPRDFRGFMILAEFFTGQREYPAAEQALRTALEIKPDSVPALLAEGVILARQGREHDAEAERDFKKACELAPSNPKAHFQWGVFLDNRGRYAEGAAAFHKVISLDANNPTAWSYLGMELELAGQPEDADAAYKQGLAVNRGPRFDPLLPYHYGRFLLQLNQLAESKVQLDHAVELLPEYGAVYYQRAKLFLEMGKYNEARTDAERVLAIPKPSRFTYDFQIYYLLATIYQRLGKHELAQKFAGLARTAQREQELSRKASNLERMANRPAGDGSLR